MRALVPVICLLCSVSASYIGGWFGWGAKKAEPEATVVIPTFKTIKDYDFDSTYEADYSIESGRHSKGSVADEEYLIPQVERAERKNLETVREPELIEFSDQEDGSLFGISEDREKDKEVTEVEGVSIGTILGGNTPFYPEKQVKSKKQKGKRKNKNKNKAASVAIPAHQILSFENPQRNAGRQVLKSKQNRPSPKRIEKQQLSIEPITEDLKGAGHFIEETKADINELGSAEKVTEPIPVRPEEIVGGADILGYETSSSSSFVLDIPSLFEFAGENNPDEKKTIGPSLLFAGSTGSLSEISEFDVQPFFAELDKECSSPSNDVSEFDVQPFFADIQDGTGSSSEYDMSPLFEDLQSSIQETEKSSSSFGLDVSPLFADLKFEQQPTSEEAKQAAPNEADSSSSFEFDVARLFAEVVDEFGVSTPCANLQDQASNMIAVSESESIPSQENPIPGIDTRLADSIAEIDTGSADFCDDLHLHEAKNYLNIFDDEKFSEDLKFVPRPLSFSDSDETEYSAPEEKTNPFGIHVNLLADGSILASAARKSTPPALPPSSPRSASSFFLVSEDEGFDCGTVGCLFPAGWSSVHLRGPIKDVGTDSDDELLLTRGNHHRGRPGGGFVRRMDLAPVDLEALWVPLGQRRRRGEHEPEGRCGVQESAHAVIEQQRRYHHDLMGELDEVVIHDASPDGSLSTSSSSVEFLSSVRNRFRIMLSDFSQQSSSSSTSSEGPLTMARRSISHFFSSDRPTQPYIPVPRAEQEHTVSTGSNDDEDSSLFPGLPLYTPRFRSSNRPATPSITRPRAQRLTFFSGLF